MPDPLEPLNAMPGLAPRDAVIARALVRNNLATADVVLEAARVAAAPDAIGDLLDHLTEAGHLDPVRARQIEEALERKLAEKRTEAAPGQSAQADEQPPPSEAQRKRGGYPRRGTAVLLDAIRDGRTRQEDRVFLFLGRFVRSRLHALVLAQLAGLKEGIVEPRTIAKRSGASEKQVRAILSDWKEKGWFIDYGTFPFYFRAPEDQRESIARFLKAWKDPALHAKLVSKILEIEKT
jgi:hypothetical protein